MRLRNTSLKKSSPLSAAEKDRRTRDLPNWCQRRIDLLIPLIGIDEVTGEINQIANRAVVDLVRELAQIGFGETVGTIEISQYKTARQAIAILSKIQREFSESNETESPRSSVQPKPAATVNARMIDEMGRNPEAQSWSLRKWAGHLGCAPTSVQKTTAWQSIMQSREANRITRKSRTRRRYET